MIMLLILFAVSGAVLSSFVMCLLYRQEHSMSFFSRSMCETCRRPLSWYNLFPVFGAVFARFRCTCGADIPKRYTGAELCSAAAAALCAVCPYSLWLRAILGAVTVVLITEDFYSMQISMFSAAALYVCTALIIISVFWFNGSVSAMKIPVISGIINFLFFLIIYYFSQGRMEFGDVLCARALSLFIEPLHTVPALFISSTSGIAAGALIWLISRLQKKNQITFRKIPIPFVPFLILGYLTAAAFAGHMDKLFFLQY